MSLSRTTPGRQRINPWKQFHGVFLPLWLLDRPEISFGAKALYAQLARNAGSKGVAWPSQKFLARQLGIKERQLRTYLGEIRRAGLVEIERRGRRKGGSGATSRYWFVDNPWIRSALNFERQPTAGRNRFERQPTAGRNPRALKDRARAASEVSHKHEVSHRAGRGKVDGRSHAISKTNPRGKAFVQSLTAGLAEKFRTTRGAM